MASLKLLKDIAEHSMEHYEIPWDDKELQHLIAAAEDCTTAILEFEQAYTETQEALHEVEEELLTMYKIRVLYERYLAINKVTQEVVSE